MKKPKTISRLLIAISALLLVSAYFVPLWQILMWAPQYPEGLEMKITEYVSRTRGLMISRGMKARAAERRAKDVEEKRRKDGQPQLEVFDREERMR